MSYEATIVCDRCSTVIAAHNTARQARAENRHSGGRSAPPWDLCQACVAMGHTIPRPRRAMTETMLTRDE